VIIVVDGSLFWVDVVMVDGGPIIVFVVIADNCDNWRWFLVVDGAGRKGAGQEMKLGELVVRIIHFMESRVVGLIFDCRKSNTCSCGACGHLFNVFGIIIAMVSSVVFVVIAVVFVV